LVSGFVHLHVHSDFSLLDASASVEGLVKKAQELDMKALALTDHGNMFGAIEFFRACKKTKGNLKPIIGCEVYVSPSSRFDKKGSESENAYYHLVLLAANREGYFNLMKLCSFAYTEGFYYRPRVDDQLLAEYSRGLIALSACASGEIPRLIQNGKLEEATAKANFYRDLFGKDENGNPNFYLEIQDHGIPGGTFRSALSQKDITNATLDIAKRTGIPLVATNDVHYLEQSDSIAHDVLLCVGTGKVRTEEKRKKYYGDQFYLKTPQEMASLFPEVSFPDAIANTLRIADRCNVEVPDVKIEDLPKYLPEFEIPAGYNTADDYLKALASEGLVKRYPEKAEAGGEEWQAIQERNRFELDTIIQMGFTGYFLIVADFINWAHARGIPVGPGRGSGAGSIVAYALRITDIDPLKYSLLFERFLNPERVSMPDFDVDFANEGRDDVMKYVSEKYGRERVGQIITFGTLGAKAVIKDVARVLEISIPESEMITKLIPKDPQINLEKAIAGEPKLQEMVENPRYTELFSLAKKLEGLNRHLSLHAAGVVIGKSNLNDFVPLYREPKTGGTATQYSMNYLETCGLVKMDFLGLKTLDVIKHATALIRRRGGQYADFSVENINENDEATFKMLGEGKSFGVFQFESEGMQSVLKRARPNSIEDLIALNSLYRPGPMENIDQFVDSKNGRQKIVYPDKSLEEILKETYGVIVYQEQVMQVAQIVGGFSLGSADELRRAMGKKIMDKMIAGKAKFISGAVERGYNKKKADEIFELLVPFAGYGFNKSHAAAYSVIAYRTAYLKANFSTELIAANLTNEIHSTDKDKLSECIAEARRMGLEIDPPDINRSDKLFNVVDGRIVYGLLGIKGLGDGAAEEIVARRNDGSGGQYKDFMDFLDRVDIKAVGKSVIDRLIQTGAFDNFGITQGTLSGNLERAVEYAQNIKDDKKYGQVSLFGDTGEKEYPDFEFQEFPEMGSAEKLKIEKELIGFYFSGHPMDEYREIWEKVVKVNLGLPENLLPGTQILVGLVKNVKPITTSKGDKMAFATLEDYNGEIELTFFSSAWKKCQDKIEAEKVTILKGKIEYQKDRDKRSFNVEEYLDDADVEKALKEEEAQTRKWDKYRNIFRYTKDLDLRFPNLAAQEKIESGTYTLIGALKSLRTHIDSKGKEMAFASIQGRDGEMDALFFARAWENCKALVSVDEILALKGSIDPEKDRNPQKPSFLVSSVQDINRLLRLAAKKAAELGDASDVEIAGDTGSASGYRKVHIRLATGAPDDRAALSSLKAKVEGNPGNCPVYIHIPVNGTAETIVRAAAGINAFTPICALAECAAVADAWGDR